MNENHEIEGVFFVNGESSICEDWCPLCRIKTSFLDPVMVKMDFVEKRKLNCGHLITYVFLVERLFGEPVNIIRKRIG